MDQATSAHQALSGHQRERRQDADLGRHRHLCSDCHRQKELGIEASLYTFLQILSVSIFEKTTISCALSEKLDETEDNLVANQLNLFHF
jgi:hypothetical protein